MKKTFRRVYKFLKNRYTPRGAQISFSQSGEDIIISEALKVFNINQPSYIDIGGHHPIFGNNTYLLYKQGCRGVIVEPNTKLQNEYSVKRSRDTFIIAGAGGYDSEQNFYSFERSTRNTFSKEQADEWTAASGQKPQIETLSILSLNTIISKYFLGKAPSLVTIDAEGLDFEILNGFDWSTKPSVLCIETLNHAEYKTGSITRNQNIYNLLRSKGYIVFAETPANTIFIDTIKK